MTRQTESYSLNGVKKFTPPVCVCKTMKTVPIFCGLSSKIKFHRHIKSTFTHRHPLNVFFVFQSKSVQTFTLYYRIYLGLVYVVSFSVWVPPPGRPSIPSSEGAPPPQTTCLTHKKQILLKMALIRYPVSLSGRYQQ